MDRWPPRYTYINHKLYPFIILSIDQWSRVVPWTLFFLAPLFSFSAFKLEAILDLSSLLIFCDMAPRLFKAAFTAACFSSAVSSVASVSSTLGYYSSGAFFSASNLAFFFSFFFLFLELPSPTFYSSATFFFSSFLSPPIPDIKASNSASSWAFFSFLDNCFTGASVSVN